MRRLSLLAALILASPLAAQNPTPSSLDGLAFMAGCWSGPYAGRAGTGTVEERWTSPSLNVMQGMSRSLVNGRTVEFEFMLVATDSAGVLLVPYPGGRRSSDVFRATRLAGDTVVFEAPEHDYPKRISYARTAAGLQARIDGGPDDPSPSTWAMTAAPCVTGPNVAAMPSVPPRRVGPDRSGRVSLIVFETLNGLYLGVAVPAMLGANEPTPYGIGLLVGGPLGALGAKAYTDSRPVSAGQSTAIVWGGWFGLWQTIGWTAALSDNVSTEGGFGATVAGLVGGTVAGAIIARNPIKAGDAWMGTWGSIWGTWYGLTAGVVADQHDDALLSATLAGGLVGLGAAAAATGSQDWSSGRVWLVSAMGIAGAGAGFGIDLIAQTDNDQATLGIPMATSLLGLATGVAVTRNMDRGRVEHSEGMPEPSMLAVRDGRLSFGLPTPTPALVPVDNGRERRWVPGMRFTLFDWTH